MNCELLLTYYTPALRQTGSRNLTGPKTLPTIWGTYMKLVTKYQISAINSCWEKCDEKCAYMFNVYKNNKVGKQEVGIQASTLTFVRLSGTSENWRRTSRSCIKWKNQIPKRGISTGLKYWVCCIKEPCLISNLSIIYFD
jgi:hypothetical protein